MKSEKLPNVNMSQADLSLIVDNHCQQCDCYYIHDNHFHSEDKILEFPNKIKGYRKEAMDHTIQFIRICLARKSNHPRNASAVSIGDIDIITMVSNLNRYFLATNFKYIVDCSRCRDEIGESVKSRTIYAFSSNQGRHIVENFEGIILKEDDIPNEEKIGYGYRGKLTFKHWYDHGQFGTDDNIRNWKLFEKHIADLKKVEGVAFFFLVPRKCRIVMARLTQQKTSKGRLSTLLNS